MNNLNILVDCHVFDQSLQGTTTYIKGVYLELIKDKTKNFYFVSHSYNLEEIFGKQKNVFYIKFKSKNKFYRLLIELPQIIKKHSIDYAHFQYIVPPIKRCKYIVTLHDVLFLDYPKYFSFIYKVSKKILYKLSAKYSDIVLTVSEFSKERIEHHFNLQNIYITPNAVESSFYEKYDKVFAQKQVLEKFGIQNYFLFVSRWEPRKNHHLLLKVFVEKEYYKEYNLLFLGDEAIENKEYNHYYKSLSNIIKNKVYKLNKINFQDLLLINRAAKLSIYPSIAEGFGIPPLESIACGIPTVCSNSTAMSDFNLISDCLFNPFDAIDLDDKIKIALSDLNLEEKKDKVFKKYNWSIAAKQIQNALLEKMNL
jgi:glycosyltransferase involved in cell wall biosynthesis